MDIRHFQAYPKPSYYPVENNSDIFFRIQNNWSIFSDRSRNLSDFESNNYHMDMGVMENYGPKMMTYLEKDKSSPTYEANSFHMKVIENNFNPKMMISKLCSNRKMDYVKKSCPTIYDGDYNPFDQNNTFSKMGYSGLTYLIGGFVGSKSQMHSDRTSFDLWSLVEKILIMEISERNLDKDKSISPNLVNITTTTTTTEERNIVETNPSQCSKLEPIQIMEPQKSIKEDMCCSDNSRVHTSSICSVESSDSESIIFDESVSHSYSCSPVTSPISKHNSSSCFKRFCDICSSENFSDDEDSDDDCGLYDESDDDLERRICDANESWNKFYGDVDETIDKPTKIHFSNQAKVHRMVVWNYAYRVARVGNWLQYSTDRARFRVRIEQVARLIEPVLKPEHREKIFMSINAMGDTG